MLQVGDVPRRARAAIAGYFTPQWQNGIYKGVMYSLPFNDTSVTVLWYNPKITSVRRHHHNALHLDRVCRLRKSHERWELVHGYNRRREDSVGADGAPVGWPACQSGGNKDHVQLTGGHWPSCVKKGSVHYMNNSTSQWHLDFASGHVTFDVYSSEGAVVTPVLIPVSNCVALACRLIVCYAVPRPLPAVVAAPRDHHRHIVDPLEEMVGL